jgi:hypothetical protein
MSDIILRNQGAKICVVARVYKKGRQAIAGRCGFGSPADE